MTNGNIIESLEKKIRELNKQLSQCVSELAEKKTENLKKRIEYSRNNTDSFFKTYTKVFGSPETNPLLERHILRQVSEYPFRTGIRKRLKELNIYYVWEILSYSKAELEQDSLLGKHLTYRLIIDLERDGLYLGMDYMRE